MWVDLSSLRYASSVTKLSALSISLAINQIKALCFNFGYGNGDWKRDRWFIEVIVSMQIAVW